MNFCQICKQPILDKDLNKTYQFTLGNMINGKFLGLKKQYFHVSCMEFENNKNPQIISTYNE
ncbi:MAG: hypothetical protein MUP85_10000 [Candidatus Lokiarchaeota archaeon]|jgi:hypothetical protein|nr:hypothetical protein [Candidatus Lokiarchaeota archaeon]